MIEKGKISSLQMGMLMFLMIGATSTLIVPAITAQQAERDMWISPIWGSISGFVVISVSWILNRWYPQYTVIQYSISILGRYFGRLGGLLILYFLIHGNALITREYGEFIVSSFLLRTPSIIIMTSLIIVCAIAVRCGLEAIARATQIFLPFILLIFLGITILLIPDLKPYRMFPIMENGIMPSIIGSVLPHTWFMEFFLISFLYPYVSDRSKTLKWGFLSVLGMMVMMVITNISSLFLFGNLTGSFHFPVFEAASYISFANFIEHMDAIVMVIWVLGGFVQISLWYYALALGIAQWLNLNDYRPLVYPLGLVIIVTSIWVTPNLNELIHFFTTDSPFYSLAILILYPVGLMVISMIRRKMSNA
ncbi:spore gernimation protein [Paenibacillus sp. H1-7]|uniref:GerAB/ArcD/ProY family transporter n=1 Tax=Paenibacillus sp. H1-7 TaxID=2282849 RepID=UPI001EF93B19|nr:endospore germination permease [Paenibacillus sp. H1-7]ULL16119.1 spore gernimation protein [Paenibacillus sp. H1-7]